MESLKLKVKEIEKEEITRALRESGWIMARAARLLGITERMISYKIRKYGIRRIGVEGYGEGMAADDMIIKNGI